MATAYTTLLGLALPVTGELNGTWGTVVNDSITELVEDAIAGSATASVTSADWTLTTTGSGAANQARSAILIPTGTPGVSRNIIVPSSSKAYIVDNQSNAAVVVKGSATTGVSIATNTAALVAWDGADFVLVAQDLANTTGTLAVNKGGTGQTTYTDGQLLIGNTTGNTLAKATLTQGSGVTITNGAGTITIAATGLGGDVVGPASATDNAIARYDGTTGKIIQNSAVTIADDGATVIAANSTSDGLRITQVGTGNALTVEDSANPDATPTVITSSGDLVVGYTSSIAAGTTTPSMQTQGNSGTSAAVFNWASNGADPARLVMAKSNSGTIGTRGSVASGNRLGLLRFFGDDGTAFIEAASLEAQVDGTPGTNDMPGRLVLSTTADGASSPTEKVRIDNQGSVGIGSTSLSGYNLRLGKNITGGSGFARGVSVISTAQSDVTSSAWVFQSEVGTQAASFTLPSLVHFHARQATFGVGSIVTDQFGFVAQSTLIGATNNYGFYSNIASGTGRWNFYAAGSADNYFAGNVGVGVVPESRLHISGNTTAVRIVSANNTTPQLTLERPGGTSYRVVNDAGAFKLQSAAASASPTFSTNVYHFETDTHLFFTSNTERVRIDSAGRVGIGATPSTSQRFVISGAQTLGTAPQICLNQQTLQSDATGTTSYFQTFANTAAASFTSSTLNHYRAFQGTFGASSVVTNQAGFSVDGSLTGATNNFGFYSDIASGVGRWNFYAAGSADNYFAGDMQLDKTVTAGGTTGAQTINKNAGTVNFAAAATSLVVTDSRVTTSSIIICTVGTNDTTLKSVAAVAGAGSFTLHASAAATAETRVNFLIIN